MIWVYPKKDSVCLTKLVHPRILSVTWVTPICPRRISSRPKLPALPQSTLPLRPEPTDPKRKKSSKGKEPMDGGKSRSSQEEDEARELKNN